MNAPETGLRERSDSQAIPVIDGPLVALALDPGRTTGYVIAIHDNVLKLYVNEDQLSLMQLEQLLASLMANSNLHIIYEDFEYRNMARTGLDLTPVKLIGIIEFYREKYEPFVYFYKQSAATGKAFWSDDKLKQAGAYKVGKKHGRDATRHLLQWAKFGAGAQYIDLDKVEIVLIDKL
jgi:hypothetical protein